MMERWLLDVTMKIPLLVNILLCVVIKTDSFKINVKLPDVNSQQSKTHGKLPYKGDITGLEYIYHTTCTYNGVTYATGEFHLSKCVLCNCNGTTGEVKCTAKACPRIKNCIRYETNTTDCCPKCLEYGCYYNESYYRAGEKIGHDACNKCFCPWEAREEGGAKAKCFHLKCKHPNCVDSVVPHGKCCAICPNGQNCYLDKQVISDGERIYVDKCRYCYCTNKGYQPHDLPRRAVCGRSFFCL